MAQGEAARPIESTDGSSVDIQLDKGNKTLQTSDRSTQELLLGIQDALQEILLAIKDIH